MTGPDAGAPDHVSQPAEQVREARRSSKRTDNTYPAAPDPLPVNVFDSHCHLDIRMGGDALAVADALAAAAAVGVAGIVQVGVDVESSRWGAQVAALTDNVLAAVALHPNEAPLLAAAGGLEAALAEIEALAGQERVRAVGETGLDFFRTEPEGLAAQELSFRRHIDLAKRTGKALVIHDRDAHDDVVRVLDAEGAPETVVFHCFSGGTELARTCADRGWHTSFAGTVTFKNAEGLRDALRLLPSELLLVETDAPFLTPMPYRGRPNASYLIPLTLRTMAQVRGEDVAELAAAVAGTTQRVFGGFRSDSRAGGRPDGP
jgi:TatD DNase family protein